MDVFAYESAGIKTDGLSRCAACKYMYIYIDIYIYLNTPMRETGRISE